MKKSDIVRIEIDEAKLVALQKSYEECEAALKDVPPDSPEYALRAGMLEAARGMLACIKRVDDTNAGS